MLPVPLSSSLLSTDWFAAGSRGWRGAARPRQLLDDNPDLDLAPCILFVNSSSIYLKSFLILLGCNSQSITTVYRRRRRRRRCEDAARRRAAADPAYAVPVLRGFEPAPVPSPVSDVSETPKKTPQFNLENDDDGGDGADGLGATRACVRPSLDFRLVSHESRRPAELNERFPFSASFEGTSTWSIT